MRSLSKIFKTLFSIMFLVSTLSFVACGDDDGGGDDKGEFKLSKSSLSLGIGVNEMLIAYLDPSIDYGYAYYGNVPKKKVSWSSTNTSIATVSDTGKVKGLAAGSATITATTADGKDSATCAITVVEFTEVQYNDLDSWVDKTADPNVVNYVKLMNVPANDFGNLGKKIENKGKKFFFKIDSVDEQLTALEDDAFYGVKELTGLDISACTDLTAIGENAFSYCRSFTNINFPQGLISIGENAFKGCNSLLTIDLPPKIISIGKGAFVGCSYLKNINVHKNNSNFSSQDGVLFNKDKTTLIKCPPICKSGKYSVPSTVTTIEDGALGACNFLTTIDLPKKLISIREEAFAHCLKLTSIDLPRNLKVIGKGAWIDCVRLTRVDLPESLTTIGEHVFHYCRSLKRINVHKNNAHFTSEDDILFNKSKTRLIKCLQGKSGGYSLPSTVTSIDGAAFENCSSLTSINLPDNLTTIGSYAFANCSSLKNINLPGNLTTIGDGAFYDCSSLTSIELPKKIKSIGWHAFEDCEKLTKVTVPNKTIKNLLTNSGYKGNIEVINSGPNVAVTGVSLNSSTLSLTEGKEATLTATVSPDNATNTSVTWNSNNKSVATVDSSGKVTAVAEGSADITVTTVDGNHTATCKVTVTKASLPAEKLTAIQTAFAHGIASATIDNGSDSSDVTNMTIKYKNADESVKYEYSYTQAQDSSHGDAYYPTSGSRKYIFANYTDNGVTINGTLNFTIAYSDYVWEQIGGVSWMTTKYKTKYTFSGDLVYTGSVDLTVTYDYIMTMDNRSGSANTTYSGKITIDGTDYEYNSDGTIKTD